MGETNAAALEIIGAAQRRRRQYGLGDTIFLFVRGCPIGIIHHRGVTHSPPATPESERQLLRESLQNVTLRERVSKSGGAHFSSLAVALSLFLISPDYSHTSVFPPRTPFSSHASQAAINTELFCRRAASLLYTHIYTFVCLLHAGLCEDDSPQFYYKRITRPESL